MEGDERDSITKSPRSHEGSDGVDVGYELRATDIGGTLTCNHRINTVLSGCKTLISLIC